MLLQLLKTSYIYRNINNAYKLSFCLITYFYMDLEAIFLLQDLLKTNLFCIIYYIFYNLTCNYKSCN